MPRDAITLQGRVLYLTDDVAFIRRQLDGETLQWPVPHALRAAISTVEITPGWVCFHYDETLGRYCLVGLAGGVKDGKRALAVAPGGGLTAHHAQHAGTGLAHAHAAAARDYETIRAHARGRERLVDDLAGADLAGLRFAVAALAARIAPQDAEVAALAAQAEPDPVALRRAVLEAVRPSRPAPVPDEVMPL